MALPLARLSPTGKKALDTFLHSTVSSKRVPATWLGVTNAQEEIYWGSEGDKVWGQEGEVDDGTTLQLFSTTKFVTSIACMQQVDSGLLSLDDPELVEKHCPELAKQPILLGYGDDGKPETKKREKPILLRHLLTHTSGLSYTWNSPLIARWHKENDVPSAVATTLTIDSYAYPILFEPGTRFNYSIGMDWAGILVSRVLGKPLEQIFQENIFAPCGIKSISFHPTQSIKDRMVAMCNRVDGNVGLMKESPMGRDVSKIDPEKVGPIYMGGGGLYGTARDYLRFLRGVLASADPSTSSPLISSKAFKTIFTDQLESFPEVRQDLAKMGRDQNIHDPKVLDGGKGTHIDHGVGLFINTIDSVYGRKAGSGFWDGAAKTMFWLDPKSGLAAVCFTNLMSSNPDPWNKVFNDFERELYDHLA